MLLGRLFEKLFAGGVTLVATSNTAPDDLYRDGLNRQLFLPFIALLKAHAEIVRLDGATDYRRLKFEGEEVYHFGTGPAVKAAMDAAVAPAHRRRARRSPPTIESLGREIPVPLAAMGAARFPFAELCEKPLGARDYLRLAHAYDTLDDRRRAAVRPPSAATPASASSCWSTRSTTAASSSPRALPCRSTNWPATTATAAEFARTTSRLIEMQSEAYLEAPHKADAAASASPKADLLTPCPQG